MDILKVPGKVRMKRNFFGGEGGLEYDKDISP